MNIFSFDAETDGLHGDVWAIGAVVQDEHGTEIARFAGQVDPADLTNQWVIENVVPHVNLPVFSTRLELRDAFWKFWLANKNDALCIADVGSPVESGLFSACIADDLGARQWSGPYPLHEVATLLFAAGVDPDLNRVEFSGLSGLIQHNPVDDAIASAACWRKAMKIIRNH